MRLLLLLLITAVLTFAANSPLLLQKPALNGTHIVFVYAGDLWSVPRTGGDAVRLTSGPGIETDPAISPDGTRIAFTGEYDGNIDVFVVPVSGGVPKRLTWHPAPDRVMGWTPDGKSILFTSPRTAYSRFGEMFTVPVDGGMQQRLPLPTGYEASMSPDGQSIAYQPTVRSFQMWKRYRGGRTTRIWLAKLSDSTVTKVPRVNSNDFNPMWSGDRVYFLSDRNGPVTLFSYDTKTKAVRELIKNDGLDLKSASVGKDAIAYEQFGSIHLFDLKTGKTTPVPIRVQGDLPELRARFVNVGKRLGAAALSPNGARAVFAPRGEIVTVPAEKGDPRNITNTPGVMERDPQWSPDGKMVAYLSDESGEYALHLRPQNGAGEVTKIELKPGFYRSPRFSPDSKKIVLVDSFQKLWYVDLESKRQVEVAQDYYQMRSGTIVGAWSPDSKWLAYSKVMPNQLAAIHVYSLADGKSTQVTDGLSDAANPVFDKDGKYLYFSASTDAGQSLGLDIHAIGRSSNSAIYLAVLDKTLPSPFAPESDEEKAAADAKPAEPVKPEGSGDAPPAAESPKPQPAKLAGPPVVNVKIDLDDIGQRILAVPMPPQRYIGLLVPKPGILLALQLPNQPMMPPPGGGPFTGPTAIVHRYDLKARRSDTPLTGISAFEMSHSGDKALYRQGDNWHIAALRPMPPAGGAPPGPPPPAPPGQSLKTDGIEVRVDPAEEWKQMYREAFRIERDWFYDRNTHGYDLKAAAKKYEPYLENIASRQDLTYLFQEMLGDLVVGHLGTGGGDIPEVKRVQTGLLGADYEVADGKYRFARVYNGENWNPQLRAPLTQPGVNVKPGEYLLAVNGREVRAQDDVYSFFEGLANKSVVLKVGSDAAGAGSREVTVVPVPDETGLRNLAWIEDNRRKVEKLTNGKVAYIYMPDTAFGGLTAFNRYFYAQIGKEAAIVDERFNGGGLLATDIAEILNRKPLSALANRVGEAPLVQPQGIFGPKVMIINENAGSGGDAMPWYFKRSGAGKLVGTRTWGGLVGMAGAPPLMDGGGVSAPSSGVYNPITGEWEVENIGIAPDVEVEQDPALVRQGRDPQLEKAVEVVLEELKKNPPPKLRKPAFPNYHKTTAPSGAGL
jgi:tricorn protease